MHATSFLTIRVEAAPVGVDYWKHIENKAGRFEQMWIELCPLRERNVKG